MKIAIVVAAILVAAWVSILTFRPDLVRPAQAKKSDIYGLAPGMTLEEVDKLITQRKYRCRQVQDSLVVDCNIEGNRVSVALDGASDKRFGPAHHRGARFRPRSGGDGARDLGAVQRPSIEGAERELGVADRPALQAQL